MIRLTKAATVAALRSKRRKRLRRPPRILPPDAVERRYLRLILTILAQAADIVDKHMIPALPRIVRAGERLRPTNDSKNISLDDYGEIVANMMALIKTEFFGRFSDQVLENLAEELATAVATHNGKQIAKVWRAVVGIDVFFDEPWLAVEMRAFVKQNVNLIKTIPSQYFDRVEQIVFDGARRGIRHEEIKKLIRAKTGGPLKVPEYNARRIARDQMNKFNGQLSMLRQREGGIEEYTWRDSNDERVRTRHQELDGQRFRWDEPSDEGHPGDPIQCRCYAEPYFEGLLDEV